MVIMRTSNSRASTMTLAVDRICQTCAFLVLSESSETLLFCGERYYSQPPKQRVAEKMTNYKSVKPYHSCSKWQQHSPSILRDRVA